MVFHLEEPRGEDIRASAASTRPVVGTVAAARRGTSLRGRAGSAASAALVATGASTASGTVASHRLRDRARAAALSREVVPLVALRRALLNGTLLRHRVASLGVLVLSTTVALLSTVAGRRAGRGARTGPGAVSTAGRVSLAPVRRPRTGPRLMALTRRAVRLGAAAMGRPRAALV